ncbi:MAG: SWIM zinc finger family protein [Candidatus Microbacterium phytovorans]|uniref:SWIM zinc finger family protein n=1 Tax=Candidatus Microbacterium phytovorans TaxID=3121374 RepID=A0AAJ5VXT3_9MICO|nr:SWIM zinc finger family protein [Microbacterium sp.]WEK12341.1 MAG: SWIM zinc finger family protein [Microbacterium sp.]
MTDAGTTEAVYRYAFDSVIDRDGIRLATTRTDASFFSGFVEHPKVLADALLVLARISRTRYYVPPGMLAAVLRAADPVVTVAPDSLRFEAFSACCGVYARLDVTSDGMEVGSRTSGVTNVDVNPPLRAALAALRDHEPLHLVVTSDAMEVSTMDATVREEKVTLPDRWVRGFAETQVALNFMSERLRLDAASARRMIRSLPSSSPTRSLVWVVPTSGTQVRLATRAASDGAGVPVAGPERLRAIDPLLRHATSLRGYGAHSMASAWVVDVPGGRFTLCLSPDKSRGFSGEGGLLEKLLVDGPERSLDAQLLDSSLSAGIYLPPTGDGLGLETARFDAAVAVLATGGRLGYDLESAAYFHRPLPLDAIDFSRIEEAHPRLVAARGLVSDGAVTGSGDRFVVRSGDEVYQVRRRPDATFACTCAWYARHASSRGPCKHILAARLQGGVR